MRGHASDAIAAVALVNETQRAHDAARIVLDPEMHGVRRGVQRVDVLERALLLDDEDRLTHRQDSEQRARGQLLEMRRVNLRRAAVVQLATCGATALVQNEQRRAERRVSASKTDGNDGEKRRRALLLVLTVSLQTGPRTQCARGELQ